MFIFVVIGIQTIRSHNERNTMNKILIITIMLLTLGPAFGIEILCFESHRSERPILRRISEEDHQQFSDLSDQQQGNFLVLIQAIYDNNFTFVSNRLDQDNSIINIEDRFGRTLLVLALLQKHDDIAMCLIEHGADVNQMTRHGANPLLSAKSIDMAEYLFQHGANLSYTDEDKDTLLHLAVKSGKTHLVEWLIKKGVPVNQKNKSEQTPLCLAVQITDVNIVKSLIKNCARITEEILESAKTQCRLAEERYSRLSIPTSTEYGKYLSEELKACQEILGILEAHFIANQIR